MINVCWTGFIPQWRIARSQTIKNNDRELFPDSSFLVKASSSSLIRKTMSSSGSSFRLCLISDKRTDHLVKSGSSPLQMPALALLAVTLRAPRRLEETTLPLRPPSHRSTATQPRQAGLLYLLPSSRCRPTRPTPSALDHDQLEPPATPHPSTWRAYTPTSTRACLAATGTMTL